ncbi:hypothetical protein MASR2M64_06090 [Candidatus Cloacimonadota bacterium]
MATDEDVGRALPARTQAFPTQAFPKQAFPTQAFPKQAFPKQAFPTQAFQLGIPTGISPKSTPCSEAKNGSCPDAAILLAYFIQ